MADAMLSESSLAYAESFAVESDIIAAARERGHELGCVPIGPAGGATLRMLAVAVGARAVVEVGTGAGVSGLYLLDGMAPDGQLVSIDIESENQRAAKEAFTEAEVAATRYRLINGAAADVLPRMNAEAYDLVFVDADKSAYGVYYEQAIRMLRPGGVVAFDNALWHDRVADPTQRDTDTLTLRELSKTVRDDDRLAATLIAVSDGMLVAAKR
jgi:predicted O-methyltransferase YrrM